MCQQVFGRDRARAHRKIPRDLDAAVKRDQRGDATIPGEQFRLPALRVLGQQRASIAQSVEP
jgi:hypothetical protein